MAEADPTTPTFPPADTSACPNDDALELFVNQETIDPDAERIDLDDPAAADLALASAMITEHLESCETCRGAINRLREIKALTDTQPHGRAVSGPNPDGDALDHAEPLSEHPEVLGGDPSPDVPEPIGLW